MSHQKCMNCYVKQIILPKWDPLKLEKTKHFVECKTRAGIQKQFPRSKTRSRIQKHFPQSKTRARIQIVLDPGTFFRFWEVFCPYEPRYLWSILPLVLLRDAIILVCTKSPDHCLTRYGLFSDFISNHSNSIACISAY